MEWLFWDSSGSASGYVGGNKCMLGTAWPAQSLKCPIFPRETYKLVSAGRRVYFENKKQADKRSDVFRWPCCF